jgi:hypothetical protein
VEFWPNKQQASNGKYKQLRRRKAKNQKHKQWSKQETSKQTNQLSMNRMVGRGSTNALSLSSGEPFWFPCFVGSRILLNFQPHDLRFLLLCQGDTAPGPGMSAAAGSSLWYGQEWFTLDNNISNNNHSKQQQPQQQLEEFCTGGEGPVTRSPAGFGLASWLYVASTTITTTATTKATTTTTRQLFWHGLCCGNEKAVVVARGVYFAEQ